MTNNLVNGNVWTYTTDATDAREAKLQRVYENSLRRFNRRHCHLYAMDKPKLAVKAQARVTEAHKLVVKLRERILFGER